MFIILTFGITLLIFMLMKMSKVVLKIALDAQ